MDLNINIKGLECLVIAEDLTHSTALTSIINTLQAEKLDIGVLVNNVGILGPHWMPFLEMEENDIRDIMNENNVIQKPSSYQETKSNNGVNEDDF